MLSHEDRAAIDELFERLADVEDRSGPRDAEAEALIRRKMSAQPASAYYLAQTVIMQQRALVEAERRIAELEEGRNRRVPGPWERQPRDGGGQGGFLAGAAQTALGVAGGMMLGSMIGSIFSPGSATAAEPAAPESDGADDTGFDDGGFGDGGGFDGGGFDFGGDF